MSVCGLDDSIWRLAMGNGGGCELPDHPDVADNDRNMGPDLQQLWTCGPKGDIALDLRGVPDAQKCMSWSTEGTCEFQMKNLVRQLVRAEE